MTMEGLRQVPLEDSRLLPQRQSPEQPDFSSRPPLQAPPERSPTQQARWPSPPQGLMSDSRQVPLELARLRAQRQSPEQPGFSTSPPSQAGALRSRKQQARWLRPPQGVSA